jgi:hypothetical protein
MITDSELDEETSSGNSLSNDESAENSDVHVNDESDIENDEALKCSTSNIPCK